jgi:hypothetical protein
LKKVETVIKSGDKVGNLTEKGGLLNNLKTKLDKIRPMITGDEEEIIESENWEESPSIIDKGKNKEIIESSSIIDKGKNKEIIESSSKIKNIPSKNKFLEAIKLEDKNPTKLSEISVALKPITDQFPNLSKETLSKLSTREGLENRNEIIGSLPEEELRTEINPYQILNKTNKNIDEISKQLNEYKEKHSQIEKLGINELSGELKEEFEDMIKITSKLNAEDAINIIKEKFPFVSLDVDNYRKEYMKAVEEEINSGKTEEEKEIIKNQIMNYDLLELQNTGGSSNINEIKSVVRENYTYNNLMNEVKNKTLKKVKKSTTPNSTQNITNSNTSNSTQQITDSNTSDSTQQITNTMDLFE